MDNIIKEDDRKRKADDDILNDAKKIKKDDNWVKSVGNNLIQSVEISIGDIPLYKYDMNDYNESIKMFNELKSKDRG